MNCEEFQKEVMSQPNDLRESILTHSKDCTGCAEFIVEFGVFEGHVHDALQVPIPPSIQEKFIADNIRYRANNRLRKVSYALAASVMFMIGVALFVNLNSLPKLEYMIVEHIEKEPFTLTNLMNPSSAEVKSTLASLGIQMQGSVGNIRVLKKCYLGEQLVAHFVVDGQNGPVTLLVMPNESTHTNRQIESAQLQGVILPFAKQGSIAVVGYKGEPIDTLASQAQSVFNLEI
jgi:Protein of unknown function (DUF3379)